MQTWPQVGVGRALRERVPVSNCVLGNSYALMLFFPELLTIPTCHIIIRLIGLCLAQWLASDWSECDSSCHLDIRPWIRLSWRHQASHTSGSRFCQTLAQEAQISTLMIKNTSSQYLIVELLIRQSLGHKFFRAILKLGVILIEEGPKWRGEQVLEEAEGRKSSWRSRH